MYLKYKDIKFKAEAVRYGGGEGEGEGGDCSDVCREWKMKAEIQMHEYLKSSALHRVLIHRLTPVQGRAIKGRTEPFGTQPLPSLTQLTKLARFVSLRHY